MPVPASKLGEVPIRSSAPPTGKHEADPEVNPSHRTRLKLLGHARVLDAREHPELADQLAPEPLRSKVERLFLIQVISYDWNCPQYITPRFTAAEVEKYAAPLKARIAELEAQLAARDGLGPRAIDDKEVHAIPLGNPHHNYKITTAN
jgi:hypothetical protein